MTEDLNDKNLNDGRTSEYVGKFQENLKTGLRYGV